MKRYLIGLLSVMLVVLTACDSWINPDLNLNPNTPDTVAHKVVLPTIEAGIAYVLGGDFGRYTSLMTQHNRGKDRQHLGIYQYTFLEGDVSNSWETMYSGPMNDLAMLIDRSSKEGNRNYTGIYQVLMAYSLITISDLWGDIPYSEAFKGRDLYNPKYDSQVSIYSSASALLDSAVKNLSVATGDYRPGSEDIIYGGKLSSWTKAAHSLRARMAIHQLKVNNQAASNALAALAAGISSNAEDCQFVFGTLQTEANPWYQFKVQRAGDVTFGVKMSELMNATSDPRRPLFAVAGASDSVSSKSEMGPFYTSVNSAVPFLTYAEMKFIEAEAQMTVGNPAAAHASYLAAITASLQRSGVTASAVTAYLSQTSVDPGVDKLTIENIMTQKYIAMYSQCESWADWRRTGYPTLTPVVDGVNIPRSFPYPQSERLYNTNMPKGKTINTRVWWDKL